MRRSASCGRARGTTASRRCWDGSARLRRPRGCTSISPRLEQKAFRPLCRPSGQPRRRHDPGCPPFPQRGGSLRNGTPSGTLPWPRAKSCPHRVASGPAPPGHGGSLVHRCWCRCMWTGGCGAPSAAMTRAWIVNGPAWSATRCDRPPAFWARRSRGRTPWTHWRALSSACGRCWTARATSSTGWTRHAAPSTMSARRPSTCWVFPACCWCRAARRRSSGPSIPTIGRSFSVLWKGCWPALRLPRHRRPPNTAGDIRTAPIAG